MWKKFRIPHEKRTTIVENIIGSLQILGTRSLTYEEFWALKAVSFNVNSGESIGIIGENGSGKTTLLKILANILRPDSGKVKTRGKIAPILELGVGFHPDLTVKENILVYGAIMGLRNRELKRQTDSMLEFAGLERFRDAKLKNLSSGMQVRLGFSVAVETNPDIFLIDEALTVGDLEFQQRCFAKFKEYKSEGKTIVLISHALELVKEFCEKALYLSKGEMISFGDTQTVVSEYTKRVQGS